MNHVSESVRPAGHSLTRLQRFLKLLPWLILVLTLAASALALFQAFQAKDDLFKAWVSELSFRKQVEFKNFTEPVATSLKIAREWCENPAFDFRNFRAINHYFVPTLKSLPQIHALIIANSRGEEYYLRHQGNDWCSRVRDPSRHPGEVEERRWREGDTPGPVKLVPASYDPRQRPWFKGCLAAGRSDEIFWTAPYRFYADGRIGVTAALKWEARQHPETRYVVAFDVLISDLLAWTILQHRVRI